MKQHLKQIMQTKVDMFGQTIYHITGQTFGSIGIKIGADIGEFLNQLFGIMFAGSFENHVLNGMKKTA